MKRIMIFFAASIISVAAYAQTEQIEVTKFLGIPVDGTKNEMIQKLKAKGFVEKSNGNELMLEGEFNGEKVEIYVGTNNNKVYRIYVGDIETRDAYQIRLRYNKLIDQFRSNARYYDVHSNYIPNTDNIYAELQANPGKYDVAFYQADSEPISTSTAEQYIIYRFIQSAAASPEFLDSIKTANPSEYEALNEAIETGTMSVDMAKNIFVKEPENRSIDEVWDSMVNSLTNLVNVGSAENRIVWFTINCISYNRFSIAMYYDNNLNKAKGEDL